VTPAQKFELVQQELDLILKNADGSFKGGAEGAAAYTAALQKAREEMAKATDQMERLLKSGGASGGLQAFFLQLKGEGGKGSDAQFTFDLLNKGLQGFEDETVKALTGAKTSWRSFFESLDQMALKFVLNKLFSSLLNSNFASGIGSWFSGLAGAAGGAGGSAAAAAPSALSDIGINSFATGTDFAPGGLSLVGEEGPELVNLPTGAAVTPNSALRGMPGVTVHIDARGGEIGVEDKIARALSASMPHMVARAVVEASELQKRSLR
jgi:phage-related minor tail protein